MDKSNARWWRRPGGVLATGAIGGLLLAACGGTSGNNNGQSATLASSYHPATGSQGGQLIFSDWEPVQDLNVISSTAQTTTQVAEGPIWAQLWVFDAQNKPIPDLVSEVPTTQNGDVKKVDDTHMDVTIKLRSGLKWSDGSPLTTKDVNFTLKAICDPDTGAASTLGYDHIASIEDKSDTVEVWHFGPNKAPNCGLSADLTSGIFSPYIELGNTPVVPQSVLGSVAHKDWATNAYFTQKPTVTDGPYMVQDFTPGPSAIVTLVPNPHYADGRSGAQMGGHKPYLDKLTYKIYGDKSSQIAGIKSGDTDLGLDLIAKDLPSLQGWTGGKAQYETGLLDENLYFNLGNNTTGCAAQNYAATCGHPTIWQNDKIMRQAIELAVDKDAINKQLVQGIGKTMNSVFPSTLAPYYDTSTPTFHRDVAKANSMLDQDGWTKGSDGIRQKNGVKCQWVISTTSGNPQRAAEEELVISNMKDIGCTVTTKNFPAGDFFNDFKGGGINATGQYDMSLYANSWSPDPDAWASSALPGQIPTTQMPSGQNWDRINDPKLTSLFTQGEQVIDINQRISIYKQVQTEWRDYAPTIQMYERPDVFGVGNSFGNFYASVNICASTCNAADWFHHSS